MKSIKGLEGDYDGWSRHLIAASIVSTLCPEGGTVADIGGAGGYTKQLLEDYDVTTVDVAGDVDVVASGDSLPFTDGAFDVALSLDVLEHIPGDARASFLEELGRIASIVVISAPFGHPVVEAAEARARHDYQQLYGSPHPWLKEHHELGLPDLTETIDALQTRGFTVTTFGSNPLAIWSEVLVTQHVAHRFQLGALLTPMLDRLIDEFMGGSDATPPSYRQLIVATREAALASHAQALVPGEDDSAVASAVEVIRTHRLEIVTAAATELIELRTHSANLEQGLDELHQELAHREAVMTDLKDEADRRLEVISEVSREADHRQQVIDELAAEAERRLRIIEDVTADRDALAAELAALRAAVESSRRTKRLVERRMS